MLGWSTGRQKSIWDQSSCLKTKLTFESLFGKGSNNLCSVCSTALSLSGTTLSNWYRTIQKQVAKNVFLISKCNTVTEVNTCLI